MTCLRSGAGLRQSYRTMVHSSPQRSLLTGAHSIARLTSAPFHPASKGEAERLVGVFKHTMKRAVREEKKSKHLGLREVLQQYRVTPHCTTGRTPAELMLGHQVRYSLSVLQPRAHKAKLQQKLPAKTKFSIGEHVHYRDFTRNRPKWVAGKVTGHVGMKMFIVQGPDGHCRRHEDQLKLRSVLKLNRQRSLNCSTAFDSESHTKTDQQCDNGVPECVVQQPDEATNEELPVLVDQYVLPRRSTRITLWYSTNETYCRVSSEHSGREDCHVSHSM